MFYHARMQCLLLLTLSDSRLCMHEEGDANNNVHLLVIAAVFIVSRKLGKPRIRLFSHYDFIQTARIHGLKSLDISHTESLSYRRISICIIIFL